MAYRAIVKDWEGISYRPENGSFFRDGHLIKVKPSTGTAPGYIRIRINGRLEQAHRIAWFLTYDEWPCTDIDHIDGDRSNNRLSNLRVATRSQNMANVGPLANNSSGFRGVSQDPSNGRWRACTTVRGRKRGLGAYSTPEEAARAYDAFVREHHGDFAWTNFES